jgi:hypothetical protein
VADAGRRSALDRPAARVAARAVFGLCGVALVYNHRDDIWPGPTAAGGTADDPVARCVVERYAQIDGMVAEGVIGPEQEALFKSRAEALCRAQAEGGGPGLGGPAGGPTLPPPGAVRPPGN